MYSRQPEREGRGRQGGRGEQQQGRGEIYLDDGDGPSPGVDGLLRLSSSYLLCALRCVRCATAAAWSTSGTAPSGSNRTAISSSVSPFVLTARTYHPTSWMMMRIVLRGVARGSSAWWTSLECVWEGRAGRDALDEVVLLRAARERRQCRELNRQVRESARKRRTQPIEASATAADKARGRRVSAGARTAARLVKDTHKKRRS